METEYATLVADPQNLDQDDLPASRVVYEQICDAIRRDQPTVKGLFDNEQLFLASGGAVSFESHPLMHDLPGGLIEIATPEVRSPEELLTCQRSLDQLVADATANSETSFDLRVLKNSSDALGHVYGCQENYEATVATGIGLAIYRLCMLLLWCMQVFTLLLSLPILWGVLLVGMTSRFWHRKERAIAEESEDDLAEEGEDFSSEPANDLETLFDAVPSFVTHGFVLTLRLIHLPTVGVLRFVARHVAFRPQRKYLAAFFASRIAICGAGTLDHEGRYRLSAKAMAIDTLSDMGGFRGEKPVFVFGHWLSQFCAKSFLSLSSTRQMFAKRQRLQIGLSDSNMSDHAEYVKFASTSLLLDLIESGHVGDLPQLRHGVDSIHRIAADWNLVSRVPTHRGELSALEIQRTYLNAAKQFVSQTPVPWIGEGPTVISRWESLLDIVTAFRRNHRDTNAAMGHVDWLTKHQMIEQLGPEAAWAEKKKVDLRYHELSAEGYFQQLLQTRPDVQLVDQSQVDRRRRSPPAGSPAAMRGWVIREFSGSDEMIHAEWTHAMVGRGRRRKKVMF
ncbi:proteasome accessory factor PafA2 family protein [Novipirellula artificiosorum]|uniref:Pup deamidase/depupylase n=1 Tax=Novipirellula artificiosorum TaxID=2528016 RepID=A0A5C6DYR9_9BACT|nr:proteasome accessory factor PafA2 family protein [Novipirellula artificiosorum]TWU42583.1 Pup deamidase/depupylase [Novipirellula artificiosorum]